MKKVNLPVKIGNVLNSIDKFEVLKIGLEMKKLQMQHENFMDEEGLKHQLSIEKAQTIIAYREGIKDLTSVEKENLTMGLLASLGCLHNN